MLNIVCDAWDNFNLLQRKNYGQDHVLTLTHSPSGAGFVRASEPDWSPWIGSWSEENDVVIIVTLQHNNA